MQYKPYQIFIELLIASAPFIVLSVAGAFMRKKILVANDNTLQKAYWRFLLLAMCGSAPIALSVKQRSFYLLPAMIPLVIGFAAYLLPLVLWMELKISQHLGKWISTSAKTVASFAIAIALFLCFNNSSVIIRDKDMLEDLRAVNEKLPPTETVIRADWSFYGNWVLRGYWLRLYEKKLCMPDETAPAHFYMTEHEKRGGGLPDNAEKIFSGKNIDLYKLPV